jgi:CYTH domain-containing protein
MALEIERKFLVTHDPWRNTKGVLYRQGYLNHDAQRNVRVRITENKAYLTIKGITQGAARLEYEYEIPRGDAEALLNDLCHKPLIEKRRYTIPFEGHIWEVDEFFGENQGLIIAEIELSSEDEAFVKPSWIGEEVTGQAKYYNVNLIRHPYRQW